MKGIELDKEKVLFISTPLDRITFFAFAEVAAKYGVSKNELSAIAVRELMIAEDAGGDNGERMTIFMQKIRREHREEALREAIAIASELDTHPDVEEQTAILLQLCKNNSFDIEDVMAKGKLAGESAEYVRKVRKTAKRAPDEREMFLTELLIQYGEPMPVTQVEIAWREAGYPSTMLHRLKRSLGIESVRLASEWAWKLP